MRTLTSKASLIRSSLAASVLLLASGAATAQAVSLSAGPTQAALSDGRTVPMWGLTCTDSPATPACAPLNPNAGANWSPVVIRTTEGSNLTITLTNNLSFNGGNIPTSLVIVGQVGGGLGGAPVRTASPVHAPQGATWPASSDPVASSCADGTFAANATNCPPAQLPRVQSFGTESVVGQPATLTWNNLKAGTYLIESGTHPSIQGPMGLYGIVIVTAAGSTPTAPLAYAAAGSQLAVGYDADVPVLLSEIDPVQNAAVDAAVRTAGFAETNVWSGQPGGCGNPASATFGTCYPPAVNYSPLYYLINGAAFDRTNLAGSTLQVLPPSGGVGPATTTGNVLVRFVNAGLKMHVPAIVGLPMSLIAEDGNRLPGVARMQNEVFLAAGKTYDTLVTPAASGGNYSAASYAVYDRQLSLSTHNQRDGGMQAYIGVAGGATSGVGSTVGSGTTLSGTADKTYYCVTNTPLVVSDPGKGVLAGAVGANGAALGTVSLVGGASSLSLKSNGTFSYNEPANSSSCGGTFQFLVNGTQAQTASIIECDAASHVNCPYGSAPTANDDGTNDVRYTSANAKAIKVAAPGILENDTDPNKLPLTVDVASITPSPGLTVVGNPDGSFSATAAAPGNYSFTYAAKNTQGTSSNTATVNITFPAASGLVVSIKDAINGMAITDYRWVIEEDRTFWIDPKCAINDPNDAARPMDSYGRPCPPLPVESLGYSFHSAHMPVVATGCVVPVDPNGVPLPGGVSCEEGQASLGVPVACDVGNGVCRDTAPQKTPLDPSQVHLDPNKHYFLSILPGDGINATIAGSGGPMPVDPNNPNGPQRPFSIALDCPNLSDFTPGTGTCGHAMGGAQIGPGQTAVTVSLQQEPLPSAKVSAFVFEDDYPLNGENDAGGGVDIIAPNEPGLGGFEVKLFDLAGGFGDSTGQPTYDQFNMPLTNALAGTIDPQTGMDACPITANPDRIVGMIPTCPTYEADGKTLSPLAGQVIIQNLYPGLYEIQAYPAADRIARGEEWLQTNTLDGSKPHEAFLKPNEPGYFQEFGPGGFHVAIGFANAKIINQRLTNDAHTGICDNGPNGAGLTCTSTLVGHIHSTHMSRSPDQRLYDTGSYDNYSFTQCYVALGYPDQANFALAKCDADGNFTMANIPSGDMALTVFDQWNDIMLDGLVSQVTVNSTGTTEVTFPVTQWRTNLYTRTYIDANADGIPNRDNLGNDQEAGLALVSTNIRYRDGSYGFFNNTDLNGYAGFNEVFPFMNWLVVETDTTRFKSTGVHVVVDTGGPVDGTTGGGNSTIGAHLANTIETNSLPTDLRVPGSVYCDNADCFGFSIQNGLYYNASGSSGPTANLSSGRIDPPWTTEGWQGLLGQNTFMDFGMKPFVPGENGGIRGHVIYASTRPFDDPSLLLQLSWEPGVPNVQINLYQEGTAPDGSVSLTLADTTTSSSWDDWAQGFRTDGTGTGTLLHATDGTSYVPNMNCPGQDSTSPFFATLQGSKQWLDTPDNTGAKKPLAYNSQFKCYDGWSQANQAQPAPYDGKYSFPSVVDRNPTTGRPSVTNCKICTPNPDDGNPMLPPGKYVVEVIVPPGFELVKEEDKNILMGDIYVAPITTQFAGLGNVFIMPDQAAVNAYYNANNPLNPTSNLGSVTYPRHEGDTGSIETYWPCVGATRIVPDFNSLFPGAGQNAPFAGASRPLCDRKEVTLADQSSSLAKFYVFTSTHVSGHFTGVMTNDFASEFDPFSPQFGEKFAPPNLPVGMRDFNGNEVARVYSDQWGVYDGLYFSTWGVNPPNPTGYAPQMSIACMNDPGPILDKDPNSSTFGQMITDPAYNPAYSNFCYETPFMPGFTSYMDTPVIPTQAFADGYNLPDSEYPDHTPAILRADFQGNVGPWATGSSPVASVAVTSGGTYTTTVPTVSFTGGSGSGAAATAWMGLNTITVNSTNRYSAGAPTFTISAPNSPLCGTPGFNCVQATASANIVNNNNPATRRVGSVTVNNRGAGYVGLPTVTVSCTGSCVQVVAANVLGETVRVVQAIVTNGGSGYTGIPTVGFSPSGAAATASLGSPVPSVPLVLTALGPKVVQNPAFSGPNATVAPYNQKAITRHYDFGAQCTTVGGACSAISAVTIGGKPATINSWSPTSISVNVPSGLPNCGITQRGQAPAVCGEVVITAGNGKQSIEGITAIVGGKAPTIVSPSSASSTTFGEFFPNPLQTAIDNATAGDLLIVDAGVYRENLIMWKPVRLQGVGSGAVTINADAHPAGKMDSWRRRVNCVFGLTVDGTPNAGNQQFDSSGTFSCPAAMYFRADRIPFEGFVGWDASSNGNLAQVLQEPSLMGAYEGAGVTVVGRGVNVFGSTDLWGQVGGAGTFPDGSRYLNSTSDCRTASASAVTNDYGTGNFQCNPSRIDGLSIINSSQGGGGIFMHGWNSNLEIANNRVFANHGTLSGGITVGNGETPPIYQNDGTICGNGVAAPAPLCPPIPAGTPTNGTIPFAFNVNVHVHNNAIVDNASIGDALFSGTPSGAGGITFSAGADNYVLDHNWISGNLATGDGAGVEHLGVNFNGTIANNWVLFNQSTNPTLPTNGGGIAVFGAQSDRTLPNGQECGTSTDVDCPPGIGDGVGPGLVIDANLILGNSAESGSGGGLRLQQVNGTEVGTFPVNPERRYAISVTNNIIVNNVAGWDGAGVSMEDALKVTFVNNTVAANDTTASAGVLFKTLGAIDASSPPPGCIPTPDPTQPQNPNCLIPNAPHIPQPAGLVTVQNTPNMIQSLPTTVVCPAGFNYGKTPGSDSTSSRTNGLCRMLGVPSLTNDMFWHNRAFHVEIVDANANPIAGSPTGTQSLVAVLPLMLQTTTGQCVDRPQGEELYWDVGVREDSLPSANKVFGVTYLGVGAELTLANSILSDNVNSAGVHGTALVATGNQPVISPYCNGARVPPENCAANQGAVSPGMCKGFNAPAGQSETTGIQQVFTFNGITPAATVDEGHNWINLTYGPLTLSRLATAANPNAEELLVAGQAAGSAGGAYSVAVGSEAIDSGASVGGVSNLNHDFFGTARPQGCRIDIGAVEGLVTPPALATISPNSGTVGGTVPVTITGTNLTADSTINVSGTGVTVSGVSANVAGTQLTATFTIAANASGTARAVTVTTAQGTSCSSLTFTVIAPRLDSISPTSGSRGTNVNVTLTGARLQGATGISISGTGVTSTAPVVNAGGTSATATFTIAANATTNARSVTVTFPGGASTGAVTFTVTGPSLTGISPIVGARGATVNVTLTGTGLSGASAVNVSGTGVTASAPVVNGAGTSLTTTFTIVSGAATNARSVTVTVNGATTNAETFTVISPLALLISPNTGTQGTQVPVTITGIGLTSASSVAVSGTGVTAGAVSVNAAGTQVTTTLTISATAATNARSVTVTNAGGATSNGVTFTVNGPTLTGISPATGTHGTTVAVTLTGTNLTGAATVNVSGTGVTASAPVVNGAGTSLTTNLTIDAGAATNARTVTVTNAGGATTPMGRSFTVN